MRRSRPTADLPEIYVDKVFALGARPYLKPRDVFDLHGLITQGGRGECTLEGFLVRLATDPNETPSAWLEKAQARRTELEASAAYVMQDLKRWLPSSWPLGESNVRAMVDTAIAALDQGMQMMHAIEEQHRRENEGPSP